MIDGIMYGISVFVGIIAGIGVTIGVDFFRAKKQNANDKKNLLVDILIYLRQYLLRQINCCKMEEFIHFFLMTV